MLFAWITDPSRSSAGTLTLLEIVLGIDTRTFLSLVVAQLPTANVPPCAVWGWREH